MEARPDWSLDRLPLGIWVARVPDGVAVYTNDAFTEMLGVPPAPDATIGDAPATYGIFGRDGLPYAVERLPFSRVVATRGAVEVDDLVIHRADGRRVFIRAVAAPTIAPDGRMTHVTVAFNDITREVLAESERSTAETWMKFAVHHAPIAVFTIDRAGTITLSEGAALAAMGVRSGQLVGQSVFDLYRDHPTIADYIRRGLAGESLWYTVEVGPAVFDTWLTPARNAAGEVIGVSGVSTDVSELRKLQTTAIQNDRVTAMGSLAASVAHEINNPLTYVLGSLDGLERTLRRLGTLASGSEDEAAVAEMLATARIGVDRIAGITRDLRSFSRPDDRRLERLSVTEVVRGVMRLSRKEAEARATLDLALGDTPRVHANEGRLVQVVLNLLTNALDAVRDAHEAAEVRLETRTEEGQAVLEVSDNGPGIPPEQRDRIFEPFVTTKPVGEGTGLGLFVCRNLVQEIGGRISVHDRPGGGALLRVVLPAADGPGAAVDPVERATPAPPPARGPSVLIIDDEPLIGETLARALRQAGFEAESMTDSAAALDRLTAGPRFDLVLCDLMMPGVTGMDVAAGLAERAPRVLDTVVFMTGGAFTPRARQFLESTTSPCLTKPFDVVTEVRRRLSR